MNRTPQSIAVIGGGLAGLTLASELKRRACVVVYEKSRGLGGRLSQRRASGYAFNHGAPFVTARSKAFKAFMRKQVEAGRAYVWNPQIRTLEAGQALFKRIWFEEHFVGTPGMNAIVKHLGEGLDIELQTRVAEMMQDSGEQWNLDLGANRERSSFDWVVSTAPVAQTLRLFPKDLEGRDELANIKIASTFALMVGLKNRPDVNWEAAVIRESPLAWLAITPNGNSSEGSSWSVVGHACEEWTLSNLERDHEDIREELVGVFCKMTGINVTQIDYSAAHRWRYSKVIRGSEEPFLLDSTRKLAVCGDAFGDGRAEGAFISAKKLARELAEHL